MTPQFLALQPILGTRDIERAISFYTAQLGFSVAFRDSAKQTNYAGLRRDSVEIHMQFQFEHEMSTTRLRFRVADPDALWKEFRERGIEIQNDIKNTPWGTREFALYDLDRNALTFYRGLKNEETNERD